MLTLINPNAEQRIAYYTVNGESSEKFKIDLRKKTQTPIGNLGFLVNGNRLDNSEVLYGPMSFQRFRYRYFPTSGMGFQQLLRWRYLAVDLQYTTVRLRRPHSIDGMDLPSYCLHGHNSIQFQSRHKGLLSLWRIRNTVPRDIQAHPMQYLPCFCSSHLHKNSYFPDKSRKRCSRFRYMLILKLE